jgi:SPP1 gp7 family putative phage head morphogenesis protein
VITVQQLVQRRRLLDASRVRHPRRVPRAVPPSGLIIAYTKVLRDLDQALDHAILGVLRDAGVVRTDDVLPIDLLRAIELAMEKVTSRRALVGVLEHIAERVSDRSGEDFGRQVRSALGVNLLGEPHLAGLFTKFRDENLKLITSLAGNKLKRVNKLFAEAPVGARVEVLERDIREATNATKSQAALIARNETLTLYSQVTQERHRSAGIERFVWSTSRDQRVRPSHAELENKEFSYSDPPIVEGIPTLPGVTAVQCRCLALPIIEV